MLEALADSGQSATTFGRMHGFAAHRVRYWREKLGTTNSGRAVSSAQGFVPVRVLDEPPEPPAFAKTETARVELHLAGGRRVVFHGPWGVDALQPWLRALEVA